MTQIESAVDALEPQTEWVLASEKPLSSMTFPARFVVNREAIIVFQTQHGLRGVEKACPHQGATWMMGKLMADDTLLRCPLHSFTFRLKDGKGINCPGLKIAVFDAKEEGDRLYLRLPAPTSQASGTSE